LFNPWQKDYDNDGMGKACDTIFNADYSINLAAPIAVLSGFTEITGSLTINNTALTNLTGLEALTSVGRNLLIEDNGALTNLSGLNSLTSVGLRLEIEDNGALTSLNGLNNLTSVSGSSYIRYNNALTSLSGLENLTSVSGDLSIRSNGALTSLSGLSNLTSVGDSLVIFYNDALTSLTGLENLTSVGESLEIYNNDALTSLTGLENLTSVGWSLAIYNNKALTSLTGLESLTSINEDYIYEYSSIYICSNDALSSLSGLYNVHFTGRWLYVYENSSLCPAMAYALATNLVNNGFRGTTDIYDNFCPPEIYNVTTNQGPEGASIPLKYLQTFTSPDEVIHWIAEDTNAAPESGEWWEWTLGIDHSYVSYWKEDMGGYSPETELTLNDDVTGYSGRWKWVSPVSYLPGDGWYSIKLIAEDMDGNRSESEHSIKVDTSATDTDSDGISDSSDNCPSNCNTNQSDFDDDGEGDVCDETPGCGGCGQPACETEC
jgi:hypothetical protein